MTVDEVMHQLESFGTEGTRKIYKNHGAQDPIFGVKVGDLKKILKKTKVNHELALELGYDSGFGAGTRPSVVAAWLVTTLVKRKERSQPDGG